MVALNAFMRERNCIRCGAPFKTQSPNKKRCDPCQKISANEQQQKANKKSRDRIRKARHAEMP